MKKQILFTILAAIMVMGTTGCSSASGASSEINSDTISSSDDSSAVSTEGSGDGSLERVKSKGVLTYALSGAYPPFSYYDKDGKLVGFDVDIGEALAKQLGVTAKAEKTDFDGIIAGLKGKRFDIAVASMAITPDRLKEVSFTDPNYYDGAQFFTLNSSKLTSIEDLKDGKVGVVTGTTFEKELKSMSNIKQVVQFTSDVENFMAVDQKRTDGLVTSRFVGLKAQEQYNLKACGPLLYTEQEGVAVRKEDSDLLAALNQALKTIESDGTYDEISNKWFSTNILKK